ncbi:hypothetical protein [Nocardia abscessus]|uniref:hypothetical protein n=1 Tax=Nocardia abscessus TaxID=120957 RepID=UPI0024584737|nr:hypothetical protein [Nocardia abscessus]
MLTHRALLPASGCLDHHMPEPLRHHLEDGISRPAGVFARVGAFLAVQTGMRVTLVRHPPLLFSEYIVTYECVVSQDLIEDFVTVE